MITRHTRLLTCIPMILQPYITLGANVRLKRPIRLDSQEHVLGLHRPATIPRESVRHTYDAVSYTHLTLPTILLV